MTFAIVAGGIAYGFAMPRYKMGEELQQKLLTEIDEADQRIAAVQSELDRLYFLCPRCRMVVSRPNNYHNGMICSECDQRSEGRKQNPFIS